MPARLRIALALPLGGQRIQPHQQQGPYTFGFAGRHRMMPGEAIRIRLLQFRRVGNRGELRDCGLADGGERVGPIPGFQKHPVETGMEPQPGAVGAPIRGRPSAGWPEAGAANS